MVLNVQGVRAEGEKIIDVRVKGNRRVETAAITNALSLKTGDLLYAEKVDADVRAVYKLGQFIDVRAETEQGDGGVVLVYTVQEKPIIREVRIEGNKELSTDKVRDALGLKANTIFSQKELTLAGKRVKKLYGDEGYYLAEVTTRLGGISVGSRVGRVATHGAAATRRVIAAGGDEAGIEVDQVAVCSRGAPQNQGNAMGVVAD